MNRDEVNRTIIFDEVVSITKIPTNQIIELKYCQYLVDTENRSVCTNIKGYFCNAFREDDAQNRTEANSQGYFDEDPVWKSLVEHEYLHSLISELLYDRPSLVLETESGGKFHPSWLRYQEEALVIGVQYLLNHDENRDELWTTTFKLVFENSDLKIIGVDWLVDQCKFRIADLWSRIEKDSQI
jgi:hypothetical protein